MQTTFTTIHPHLSGYVGCNISVELNYGTDANLEPREITGHLVGVDVTSAYDIVAIRVTNEADFVHLIPWHSIGQLTFD